MISQIDEHTVYLIVHRWDEEKTAALTDWAGLSEAMNTYAELCGVKND